MPIKPENKERYPKDWKSVVIPRIRDRSGNACEGSPFFPDCRALNGEPHPVTGSVVVLTVAHLDHMPENCDDDNLMLWCQRCHLNYDTEHHAQTRYMSTRCNRTDDMFKE